MRRAAAVSLAAMLACTACASAGTNYSDAAAASVRAGMTREQVIGMLGAPNSITMMADGGTLMLWLHSKANGMTGHAQARSVSFLFDREGRVVRPIQTNRTDMRY